MKKLTLLILALYSVTAFSARYLIQPGASGWADPVASGGTLVNLTAEGKSIDAWINSTTFASGDEIWVLGGVYNLADSISLKDGVSLYGSFAGTETAVDQRARIADGKQWQFASQTTFDGSNTITFECFQTTPGTVGGNFDGFEIRKFDRNIGVLDSLWVMKNCYVHENKAASAAGSLFVNKSHVIDSYFTGNTGTIGPLCVTADISLLIKGCVFEGNTITGSSAAIQFNGGSLGLVEDCIFKGNLAGGGGQGGAVGISGTPILKEEDSLRFENCQFIGNQADINGGAVRLIGGNKVAFINCLFSGNVSSEGRGAVAFVNNATGYFINCIIRDNVAMSIKAEYAVITGINAFYCELKNCVVVNNKSEREILSLSSASALGAYIYNSTIANNLSVAVGSVNFGKSTVCEMKNTVFFGNSAPSGDLTNSPSLIADHNAYGTAIPASDLGTNNITGITEADFVLPTNFTGVADTPEKVTAGENADWKPAAGSQLIDKGTDLSGKGVTTDIMGVTRPLGNSYDIGAYEAGGGTSIKQAALSDRLNLYPTVTDGIIHIEREVREIRLFDLNGRLAGRWSNTKQIDISYQSEGIYLLQINNNEGRLMNYKVIKQ